jgi:hypothetical protein
MMARSSGYAASSVPRTRRLTAPDAHFGESSLRITRLFDPRKDRWADPFAFNVGTPVDDGIEVRGLTALGRTTVVVLGMNIETRKMVRYELWRDGLKF